MEYPRKCLVIYDQRKQQIYNRKKERLLASEWLWWILKKEFVLRSIIVAFVANHLWMVIKTRNEWDKLINVPRFITVIFFTPNGIDKIKEPNMMYGLSNIISFILSLIVYFTVGKYQGAVTYLITWIISVGISVVHDFMKYGRE